MKTGIITIDRGLLLAALHLPEDTQIIASQMSLHRDALELRIEHEGLHDVRDGESIPYLHPQFRETGLIPTKEVEFLGYGS